MALQVLDIVALRPELELCYIGISTKCFEILEGEQDDDSAMAVRESAAIPVVNAPNDTATSDEDSDNDGDDDDVATDSGDNDNSVGMSGALDAGDSTDSEWQDDSQDDSDDASGTSEENSKLRPKFKLREILFYDDKISIFKARRAQL